MKCTHGESSELDPIFDFPSFESRLYVEYGSEWHEKLQINTSFLMPSQRSPAFQAASCVIRPPQVKQGSVFKFDAN